MLPSAHHGIDRRRFLDQLGSGFGTLALAAMLQQDSRGSEPVPGSAIGGAVGPGSSFGAGTSVGAGSALHVLHHPPKAKRVVQLFMAGAASHLDLWDYKPFLEKHHGEPSDFGEKVETFQDGLGPWLKSPFAFQQYGETGKWLSEPVSALGRCVDDIAFVHNMVGKTGVHSQATLLQATGFQLPGFPGMGSWISYGLGSVNENLPTFVVLPDHRGLASNGQKNWGSAFLSAQHQGTVIRAGTDTPIHDLFSPRDSYVTADGDTAALQLLNELNRGYGADRDSDSRLEARIRSYELAARMQLSAPEAIDLSDEPQHILKLYGLDQGSGSWPATINAPEEIDAFGRKCLIARRLLERGVRFVQIWSGCDNGFPRRNWDSHENLELEHGPLATGMAVGSAALLTDLKQRGMLDDTIVLWTTEFGRMPSSQGGIGRDHNPYVFTNWLAGGGIKPGVTYGPSDQWGYKPLDRNHSTQVYDIHATILHLLGIDHTQLTVRSNGIDRRLTDVHGHVIHDLLA